MRRREYDILRLLVMTPETGDSGFGAEQPLTQYLYWCDSRVRGTRPRHYPQKALKRLMVRTTVLGGGISGLTAAYTLGQNVPESCTVFEQNSTTGGLCRVIEKEGFKFDFVSHVLHFRSQEARQLVETLLDGSMLQIERSAWIYFRGNYVPYPFQSHMGFLPLAEKVSCLMGYWRAWISRQFNGNQQPENFEEWIHHHFGSGIARHFMTPYNSELWGTPPREMSPDWVRPFVPASNLRQAMAGLLFKRSKDFGYNSSFYYPERGGIQALVEGFKSRVPHVNLNKRATEVDLDARTLRFQDGQTIRYERLISSIPLDVLIYNSTGVPEELRYAASKLRCTTLLNLTCCLRRPLPVPYHWVYFPESEFPFFRLVFPSNISSALAPAGCSIVAAEISNPEMTRQEELQQSVLVCLRQLGIVEKPSDVAFVERNFLTHAYPVHDLGRAVRVRSLLEFLRSKEVWSIGRFGGWRYSSIDDAIVEALQTARECATTGAPATVRPH
jgi:protoporphyrinogen oxidase